MRYVSLPSRDGETVAERIRAVIDATPPQPGRQSRLGHISIEDFAKLLGTSSQRVYEWLNTASYPGEKNAERLAEASKGRYTAEQFMRPAPLRTQATARRLEQLEAAVRQIEDLVPQVESLQRLVEELIAREAK
jgi:transcriptional regulator with XRE-family HTH domain